MFRFAKIALTVAAIATTGVVAYAAKNSENDASEITKAKISLAQAVAVAEEHANGKASKVEYEHDQTGWTYDVEVINSERTFNVMVAVDNGIVISTISDERDQHASLSD